MMIELGDTGDAFASGGNRLCYRHPDGSSRCIKVLRPERSPEKRRQQKGFPKNLRPLYKFDENLEEAKVINSIDRHIGESAYQLIPHCFGFVETNLGPGLISELIVDHDGLISVSLKQYIWQQGVSDELRDALNDFSVSWAKLGMPSRDLLLHNILVQRSASGIQRLVVIDGLGWASLGPISYWCKPLARFKARRKVYSFHAAIKSLLVKRKSQENFGYHGWISESKRAG